MKTTFGQTPPNSRWVYLGPTGFCQFWAYGTAGHLPFSKRNKLDVFFPSAALSFLGGPLRLRPLTLPRSLCCQMFVWERDLLMQYDHLVSCCCAQSCHGIWPMTWTGLPQLHLGCTVWLFLTQFQASYTAVSVSFNECVSTYMWKWWSLAPVWYIGWSNT